MDYKQFQRTAASLLKTSGTAITISRDGADVAKSFGLFVNASSEEAPLNNTKRERTMLISGEIKVPPKVGDKLTCRAGNFRIKAVEPVAPTTVSVLFKVVLQ